MVVSTGEEVKDPIIGEIGAPTLPASVGMVNRALHHLPETPYEAVDNMFRQDGQIAGLWRIITTPLRANNIKVISPNKRSKRETTFIEEILNSPSNQGGMRINFQSVMSTILRMLLDGWSPHEIVWRIDDKGFVRVDKLAYRAASTIRVKTNDHGEITSYTQKVLRSMTSVGADIEIPSSKILHFVFGAEWNSIFGRSLFLQPFYHYEKKHKLYYISHIAAQLEALRIRIVRSPEGSDPDKVNEVVKLVAQLGFNSTMTLPDGFDLEMPEMGKKGLDLLPFIHHHDTQMSKAVLAQVLDIGVEGSTGSFNLSDTHLDIFITNLGLIGDSIAAILNEYLVPRLIDWNFGTGNYPRIEFVPFERDTKKFLADLFHRISSSRALNVSPEFMVKLEEQMSRVIGLDMDFDDMQKRINDLTNRLSQQNKSKPPKPKQEKQDNSSTT